MKNLYKVRSHSPNDYCYSDHYTYAMNEKEAITVTVKKHRLKDATKFWVQSPCGYTWTRYYLNEYQCDKCGNDCSGLCETSHFAHYDW